MRLAILAATALLAATATQALALDQVDLRDQTVVQVSTRKVDFRDSASVGAFYKRLERAAREACDSRSSDRTTTAIDQACARNALNTTVASLSRPMLTARHDQAGPAFASGWN